MSHSFLTLEGIIYKELYSYSCDWNNLWYIKASLCFDENRHAFTVIKIKYNMFLLPKFSKSQVKFMLGLPRWLSGKEPTCQCRRHRRHRSDPRVRKIPWSRKWQPALVAPPGKSQGQGSCHKEWEATEHSTKEDPYVHHSII